MTHEAAFAADIAASVDVDVDPAALRIVGVDEVGRGPWAGPVLAAAAWLAPDRAPSGLNDSKLLSARQRAQLAPLILDAGAAALGAASVREIDRDGLGVAVRRAMARALFNLARRIGPIHGALIDGRQPPESAPCPCRTLIGGDRKSASVAAASIIAKLARDRLMTRLDARWPGFGWAQNAGYGVPAHRAGLEQWGVTPHHRRSFRPIHKLLANPPQSYPQDMGGRARKNQ